MQLNFGGKPCAPFNFKMLKVTCLLHVSSAYCSIHGHRFHSNFCKKGRVTHALHALPEALKYSFINKRLNTHVKRN